MSSDIFGSLWCEKYRPQTLQDIILDTTTLTYFQNIQRTREIPHLLFIGRQGIGKTSLAKIIVKDMLGSDYRYINASDERGIDAVREKVISFAQTKSLDGRLKIVILDEFDGMGGTAQRALRNVMEEYSDNLRFVLTANYRNSIIQPILSRVQTFELNPPLNACAARIVDIIKKENVVVPPDQKSKLQELIQSCYPDIRSMINNLQKYTVNNTLQISDIKTETLFAEKILLMLKDRSKTGQIRKFIIENEIEFSSDYGILLKGLFEYCFQSIEDEDKKRDALLIIGKHLESHQQVMDQEINAFCCILQLSKILPVS